MYIWYDGLCNPCDIDYKSELSVGSVKDQTIIWHSDKFTELREEHLKNNRNQIFPWIELMHKIGFIGYRNHAILSNVEEEIDFDFKDISSYKNF